MRRIMFRLWIVGSALWFAFILLVLWHDSRPDAGVIAAQAALVPPAVIFAIGAMLSWAFSRR